MAQRKPVLFCEGEDDDYEIELPFTWAICGCCNGHGKSSAYLGAYTADEMAEAGPEFQDEYMRGGYDRRCDACDGRGKVKVADHYKMTREQRAEFKAQCDADDAIAAEEAAERRFGC
jgi:hypothetical protein